MKNTYSKAEKLKSEKRIGELFSVGKSVSAYPLRLVFMEKSLDDDSLKLQTGVSVSKRNFKRAVDRIRIKRLMREAYRLNKSVCFNNMTTQYVFMILYIGKEKPTYKEVDLKMKKLFDKFLNSVSK